VPATTITPYAHPDIDFRYTPRPQHAGQALRAAAGFLNIPLFRLSDFNSGRARFAARSCYSLEI
jgi:hypothetical protein